MEGASYEYISAEIGCEREWRKDKFVICERVVACESQEYEIIVN